MDVDEDAPAPAVSGAPAPIPVAAVTTAPVPPVVASITGATVVDDAASQSVSPSPSPPPEDAPDGDVPEPEDVEAGDAEVEDEAAEAETEADLQHEHRAEALDRFATIELKFALLHERVYVEKMEALAWEQALVENGTCRSHQVSRRSCAEPFFSLYPFRITPGIVALALRAIQEAR
jgi:hypothetical protein